MKRNRFLGLALAVSLLTQLTPIGAYAADTTTKIYVNVNSASVTETGASRFPFKTFAAAKDAAIEALANGPVEILFSDGTYFVDSAVTFSGTEMQSGNPLTLKARTTGGNVVISGGKEVNLSLYDSDKNIYRSEAYTSNVRQLYVNNEPAVRSVTTDEQLPLKYSRGSDGNVVITTTNTDVANWDLMKAELVFKQSFVSSRKMVSGVTVENGVATFNMPTGTANLTASYDFGDNEEDPYWDVLFLENSLNALDEPGEWCHDGKYIYYIPRPTDDMTTAKAIVPNLDKPLTFKGTRLYPISNVTLSGITFSHGKWLYPSEALELYAQQAGSISSEQGEIPAALNIEYGRNFLIENCKFTNSGGQGLNILEGSKNIKVTGSEVSNIAGTGVLVGSVKVDDDERINPAEYKIIENITFEQSSLHDCCLDYRGSVGIQIGFARNVNIMHNDIYNLPYTGVHIGWGWNYNATSLIEGIKVKYNHIYDCLKELNDGGLVYTLGPTNVEAGTAGYRNEIAYNYLQDLGGAGGYIYHDDGSGYWSSHHNVIEHNSAAVARPWSNTSPYTHDLSIINNFTNIAVSNETTTARVEDWKLEEMVADTIAYTSASGQPAVEDGNVLVTADAVKNNAGQTTKTLYSLDEAFDTMTSNDVYLVGDDAIIKDGGSIDVGMDMLGAALNFSVYAGDNTSGSYEISVDDAHTFTVYNDKVLYNGTQVSATGWSADAATDVTLTMTGSSISLAYPLHEVITQNVALTAGRVKITANGMDLVIGDLSKHYTAYEELLNSYGVVETETNLVSNGYFEKDATGWTGSSASAVYSTDYGYAGTIGSLKVTETYASGYAYTTATLEGGKWYRVSAKVRMQDSYTADSAYAELYSSSISSTVKTWGAKNTLASGWNHIKDYIMVDSDKTVNLGIKVTGSSSSTKYTYYIDNFEVLEENPTLTDSGFEMGAGCWTTNSGGTMSITNPGYGDTGKALMMNTINETYSFYHVNRPIHLIDGKTYKARARVYVSETKNGADEMLVNFSVYSQASGNTVTSHNAYQSKTVAVGTWNDFEFTVTWNAPSKNAPAYLKIFPDTQSKLIIDDVELVEVDNYKTHTTNKDFEDRMNNWVYEGVDAMTFTTGEGVKIEPTSASAKLYQETNVLVDTPYYAECFVKLDSPLTDGYAQAKVNLDLLDTKASVTSDDFTLAGSVASSKDKALSHEQWTKVGGIITFTSSNSTKSMVKVRLSASVLSNTNTAVDYRIMGFRLVPTETNKTTLTDASIGADGTVSYTATGESGSRIRYRYYTYNSGWELDKSGYVNSGASLPNIGTGDVMAVLTTTAANGADEITLILEKAAIKVLTASKNGNNIAINAVANNPTEKDFIVAVYDGNLMKQVIFAASDIVNETVTITDTFEDKAIVKAFIWDMDLLRPLCGDTSFELN